MTNINLTPTSSLDAEKHTRIHGGNAVAAHRMAQTFIDQWPGYVHVIGAGSIWHDNKDNARVSRHLGGVGGGETALLVVQDQSIDQNHLAALMDGYAAVVYMAADTARSEGDNRVIRRTGNWVSTMSDNTFSASRKGGGVFLGTI